MLSRLNWFLCFALSSTLVLAQPPMADTKAEADPKEFEPLANHFIDALQREDIVAFSQCWISIPQMEQMMSTAKNVQQRDREMLKPYFQERNKNIAFAYGVLVEQFKKQGKLADLKLVSLEIPGGVHERDGIRKVSTINLKVKLGETETLINLDDGFEYQKLWYNTDSPRYMKVPNSPEIRLQLPPEPLKNKPVDRKSKP